MDANQATKQARVDDVEPPPHTMLLTDGLDGYGVYQLAAPERLQDANVDIVFFHDLQLDAEANKDAWWTTWLTRDETCVWPQTWLPDDLSSKHNNTHQHIKARILSVCYKANAITDKESAETIMPTLARSLFQWLVDGSVDVGGSSSGAQRRIVLVGHSLGGLVIKQLVVEAATDTATATYGDAAERFMAALSGIAFYATPHQGSQLDDVIKRTFRQPEPSHWVTDWLMFFSNHTQNMNTRFDEVCRSRRLNTPMCVVETRCTKLPSGASTLVVPTASAKLDGSFQYEVAADHDDACRPPSRVDVIYAHFLSYVKHVAKPKAKPMEVASIVRVPHWERLVGDGLHRTGAVCIHGMGGSGKSTLSMVIHNQFCYDIRFNGRVCFLEMGKTPSIARLQVKLLNTLKKGLDQEELLAMTNEQRRAEISEAVQTAGHFFLVIDDVWQHADLEKLLPNCMRKIWGSKSASCFSANTSWLLVTTRNKTEVQGALTGSGNAVWIEQPKPDADLQHAMLCNWAMSDDGLSQEHQKLARQFLQYCHGLPLHLRVLGAILKGKPVDDWQAQLEELETFQTTGVLHKEGDHTHDTAVLRASLENLEPHLLLLFLDFAVFFPSDTSLQLKQSDKRPSWLAWCRAAIQQYDNMQREDAAHALICRHVNQLAGRALLTWSGKDDDPVTVHDALRDYAVEYVQSEHLKGSSAGPDAPSGNIIRAYIARDLSDKWSSSCPDMQLLHLEQCNYSQVLGEKASELRAVWITRCRELNALKLDGLKALRALWIVDCPKLPQLPRSLSNCTALTELHVSHCHELSTLELGSQARTVLGLLSHAYRRSLSFFLSTLEFTELRALYIVDCPKLSELPRSFSNCTALTELHVSRCPSLTMPDFITKLTALKRLTWEGSRSLCTLPKEIGQLTSLQVLVLEGCTGLKQLPSSIDQMAALQELGLHMCRSLESLPDEIRELRSLTALDLSYCRQLKSLPESINSLPLLQKLQLEGCSGLLSLTRLGEVASLRELDLSDCRQLKSLPESIVSLTALQELKLSGCSSLESLPDIIGQLQLLQYLGLRGCNQLASLPASVGRLASLQELNLRDCSRLRSLPDELSQLQALYKLDLSDCSQLESLPEAIGSLKTLQNLWVTVCANVEPLPDWPQLNSLEELFVKRCSKLRSLPPCFGNLTGLKRLHLQSCESLESLDNLGLLQSLQWLCLSNCSQLESLPASIANLVALHTLWIEGCDSLKSLPDELCELPRLRALIIKDCRKLTSLPPCLGKLTALRRLWVVGCSNLHSLPDDLRALQALQLLDLSGCSQVNPSLPASIGSLAALQDLKLSGCGDLKDFFIHPDNDQPVQAAAHPCLKCFMPRRTFDA